jgi:hypothetical protein
MCLIDNNTVAVLNNLEFLWSTTLHPYNILQKNFCANFQILLVAHIVQLRINFGKHEEIHFNDRKY